MDFQAKVVPPVRVIGPIIRTARERKGYAAVDVAEWVGVDPDEYRRFEEGAAELRTEILDHLKVLLGVNPSHEWFYQTPERTSPRPEPHKEGPSAPSPGRDGADDETGGAIRTEVEDLLRGLLERIDVLREENERLKALLVRHVMADDASRDEKAHDAAD